MGRHDKLIGRIESKREELIELTCDLVKIPTVNPPGEYYTDCAQFLGQRLADRNFSQPDDIANAACFLCSEEADMITGIALEVDGGRCI